MGRGFRLFDYSNQDTPVIQLINLPKLTEPARFLLIGEVNINSITDPNYRFTDIITFLNAVEYYDYVCIRKNQYKKMDDYYIAVVDQSKGVYPHVISKVFRKYISK